jgi:Zn-finger nucleic acid-binding protein
MNFIGRLEGQEIHVDLKYCERCGGLWLRPQGADSVYCADCSLCLAGMPDPGQAPPRKARRRKARSQEEDLQSSARIDYIEGVAAMEVWV